MMSADPKVGDLVTVDGKPGKFMVVEVLFFNRVRVNRWPISAAEAFEVGIEQITAVPKEGADAR